MIIIPANINKANEHFLRLAKLFQQKIKTEQTHLNNNRGKQFRQSIRFNPQPLDRHSQKHHLSKSQQRNSRTK